MCQAKEMRIVTEHCDLALKYAQARVGLCACRHIMMRCAGTSGFSSAAGRTQGWTANSRDWSRQLLSLSTVRARYDSSKYDSVRADTY